LAVGWTDKESAVAIDFSLLRSIQTGFGALPVIYLVNTGEGAFSRGKAAGYEAEHSALRLRMLEVYLHYCIHFHIM
jgi:hypothetical protein